MKPNIKNLDLSTLSIIVILIIISFINIRVLKDSTMLSFYLFLTISFLYLAWEFINYIFLKESLTITINPIHVTVILWAAYMFIHSYFNGISSVNEWSLYILCFTLLVCIWTGKFHLQMIYLIFLLLGISALFQVIVCTSQYIGILKSVNNNFEITGTLKNPNVTAMFLALVSPALFVLFWDSKVLSKMKTLITKEVFLWLRILVGLGFLFTLVILHCRTAYIGFLISVGFLVYWKFRDRFRLNKFLVIIVFSLVIIIIGLGLYQFKQNSADGRLLIWRISYKMVTDKPLFGVGYYMFEKNYNQYQAEYFKNNVEFGSEAFLAQHVNFAYNEFIQNTVEGGLVGLLLFISVIGFALYFSIKILRKRNSSLVSVAAASGIIGFSIMSFINFTLSAIPVLIVFAIYLTIVSGDVLTSISFLKITIPYRLKSIISAGIVVISLCLMFDRGNILIQRIKLYKLESNKRSFQNRVSFQRLEPYLKNSPAFLKAYGNFLQQKGNYSEALQYYFKASLYNTEVYNYINIGKMYEYQKDYIKAEQYYLDAVFQVPILYHPRVVLFHLYKLSKQKEKAMDVAKTIVNMPVKIPSDYITDAKIEAERYLKNNSDIESNESDKLF